MEVCSERRDIIKVGIFLTGSTRMSLGMRYRCTDKQKDIMCILEKLGKKNSKHYLRQLQRIRRFKNLKLYFRLELEKRAC